MAIQHVGDPKRERKHFKKLINFLDIFLIDGRIVTPKGGLVRACPRNAQKNPGWNLW